MKNKLFVPFILLAVLLVACNDDGERQGDAYFSKGDYQDAIKAYDEYIEYQPTHVKSIYNRGRSYEELGQLDKAREDYARVLEIDPRNVNANLSIGKLYYGEKDFENAAFYFDNAVQAAGSNDAQSLLLRGRAHHKLGKTNEAMEDYNAAISIDNQLGEAYLYRGALRVYLKRKKAGCADLQKAVSLKVPEAQSALAKYCN